MIISWKTSRTVMMNTSPTLNISCLQPIQPEEYLNIHKVMNNAVPEWWSRLLRGWWELSSSLLLSQETWQLILNLWLRMSYRMIIMDCHLLEYTHIHNSCTLVGEGLSLWLPSNSRYTILRIVTVWGKWK